MLHSYSYQTQLSLFICSVAGLLILAVQFELLTLGLALIIAASALGLTVYCLRHAKQPKYGWSASSDTSVTKDCPAPATLPTHHGAPTPKTGRGQQVTPFSSPVGTESGFSKGHVEALSPSTHNHS